MEELSRTERGMIDLYFGYEKWLAQMYFIFNAMKITQIKRQMFNSSET